MLNINVLFNACIFYIRILNCIIPFESNNRLTHKYLILNAYLSYPQGIFSFESKGRSLSMNDTFVNKVHHL